MIRAAILILAVLTAGSLPANAKKLSCAEGKKLKAVSGDVKSTITFTNRTPDKQIVYWVDYDGKRHNYQELDSGESYDQPTFLTHPWVVTGHGGKCIGVYLPERAKITVEAGIQPKYQPKTERKVVTREPVKKTQPPALDRDDQVAALGDDYRGDDTDNNDAQPRRKTGRGIFLEDRDPVDDVERDDTYRRNADDEDDLGDEVFPRETVRRKTLPEPEAYGDDDDGAFDDQRPLRRTWRCNSASSPAEQTICEDRLLTRLDGELNELYTNVMRRIPRRAKRRLRRHQRRWIRRRNSCGRRAECIEQRTKQRLAQLNRRMERVIRRRRNVGFNDGSLFGGIRQCDRGYELVNGICRRNDELDGRSICGPGYVEDRNGRCVFRSGDDFSDDITTRRPATRHGFPVRGRSLGGRVREAPGLRERQIAQLQEGDTVTIVEN
ncbi:MAG: lysozyme inhibitor LprI family protein, partial [Hyphomicrobiaceae bacterium]